MVQPICAKPITSKIKVKIYPRYSNDHTACYPIQGQFNHLILSNRHPNHISSDCHIEECSLSVPERLCSQTQLCQLRCLMTILDNYMFRSLLAIFRLSLRELKVLLSSLKDNLKMASRGRNM